MRQVSGLPVGPSVKYPACRARPAGHRTILRDFLRRQIPQPPSVPPQVPGLVLAPPLGDAIRNPLRPSREVRRDP